MWPPPSLLSYGGNRRIFFLSSTLLSIEEVERARLFFSFSSFSRGLFFFLLSLNERGIEKKKPHPLLRCLPSFPLFFQDKKGLSFFSSSYKREDRNRSPLSLSPFPSRESAFSPSPLLFFPPFLARKRRAPFFFFSLLLSFPSPSFLSGLEETGPLFLSFFSLLRKRYHFFFTCLFLFFSFFFLSFEKEPSWLFSFFLPFFSSRSRSRPQFSVFFPPFVAKIETESSFPFLLTVSPFLPPKMRTVFPFTRRYRTLLFISLTSLSPPRRQIEEPPFFSPFNRR